MVFNGCLMERVANSGFLILAMMVSFYSVGDHLSVKKGLVVFNSH